MPALLGLYKVCRFFLCTVLYISGRWWCARDWVLCPNFDYTIDWLSVKQQLTSQHISTHTCSQMHTYKHTYMLPYSHLQTHTSIYTHTFIQPGYFYSTSSSSLLLRDAPYTARILGQSFTSKRRRQLWVKDLPKVHMWRLERDLNLWPFGRKTSNLPMSHHAPQANTDWHLHCWLSVFCDCYWHR